MPYDINAALKAGVPLQDISEYLATKVEYDVAGARAAGVSEEEIVTHLMKKEDPKFTGISSRSTARTVSSPDDTVVPEGLGEAALRGFGETVKQTPQLATGLLAGGAAIAESVTGEGGIATGIKKAAVKSSQEQSQEISKGAQENDSWTTAYAKASQGDLGALLSWGAHAVGQAGGQMATMLTGVGAVEKIVEVSAKGLTKKYLGYLVEKEAARIAEKALIKEGLATTVEAVAAKAAEEGAAKLAVSTVTKNLSTHAAAAAMGFGMEGGEILGTNASEAVNPDGSLRVQTPDEIKRGLTATLGAGAIEYAETVLGLKAIKGKLPIVKSVEEMAGIGGRLVRGGMALGEMAPLEYGQEYAQTKVEQWGESKPTSTPESDREAHDAGMQGAVSGIFGFGGGVLSKSSKIVPPTIEDLKNEQHGDTRAGFTSTPPDVTTQTTQNSPYVGLTHAPHEAYKPAVLTEQQDELDKIVSSVSDEHKSEVASHSLFTSMKMEDDIPMDLGETKDINKEELATTPATVPGTETAKKLEENKNDIAAIKWVNSLLAHEQQHQDFILDNRFQRVLALQKLKKVTSTVRNTGHYGDRLQYNFTDFTSGKAEEEKGLLNAPAEGSASASIPAHPVVNNIMQDHGVGILDEATHNDTVYEGTKHRLNLALKNGGLTQEQHTAAIEHLDNTHKEVSKENSTLKEQLTEVPAEGISSREDLRKIHGENLIHHEGILGSKSSAEGAVKRLIKKQTDLGLQVGIDFSHPEIVKRENGKFDVFAERLTNKKGMDTTQQVKPAELSKATAELSPEALNDLGALFGPEDTLNHQVPQPEVDSMFKDKYRPVTSVSGMIDPRDRRSEKNITRLARGAKLWNHFTRALDSRIDPKNKAQVAALAVAAKDAVNKQYAVKPEHTEKEAARIDAHRKAAHANIKQWVDSRLGTLSKDVGTLRIHHPVLIQEEKKTNRKYYDAKKAKMSEWEIKNLIASIVEAPLSATPSGVAPLSTTKLITDIYHHKLMSFYAEMMGDTKKKAIDKDNTDTKETEDGFKVPKNKELVGNHEGLFSNPTGIEEFLLSNVSTQHLPDMLKEKALSDFEDLEKEIEFGLDEKDTDLGDVAANTTNTSKMKELHTLIGSQMVEGKPLTYRNIEKSLLEHNEIVRNLSEDNKASLLGYIQNRAQDKVDGTKTETRRLSEMVADEKVRQQLQAPISATIGSLQEVAGEVEKLSHEKLFRAKREVEAGKKILLTIPRMPLPPTGMPFHKVYTDYKAAKKALHFGMVEFQEKWAAMFSDSPKTRAEAQFKVDEHKSRAAEEVWNELSHEYTGENKKEAEKEFRMELQNKLETQELEKNLPGAQFQTKLEAWLQASSDNQVKYGTWLKALQDHREIVEDLREKLSTGKYIVSSPNALEIKQAISDLNSRRGQEPSTLFDKSTKQLGQYDHAPAGGIQDYGKKSKQLREEQVLTQQERSDKDRALTDEQRVADAKERNAKAKLAEERSFAVIREKNIKEEDQFSDKHDGQPTPPEVLKANKEKARLAEEAQKKSEELKAKEESKYSDEPVVEQAKEPVKEKIISPLHGDLGKEHNKAMAGNEQIVIGLEKTINDGEATAHEVIQHWLDMKFKDSPMHSAMQKMLRHFSVMFKDTMQGIKVKPFDPRLADAHKANRKGASYYWAVTNTIYLNPTRLSSMYMISHELVHALTSNFIHQKGPNNILVKQIQAAFDKAKTEAEKQGLDFYAFNGDQATALHEFLAETFSNSEFQKFLNSIKGESIERSLWDKLLNIFRSMLGMKEGSLLDNVVTLTDSIFNHNNSTNQSTNEALFAPDVTEAQIDTATANAEKVLEAVKIPTQRAPYSEQTVDKVRSVLRAINTDILNRQASETVNFEKSKAAKNAIPKMAAYNTLSKLMKAVHFEQGWTLPLDGIIDVITRYNKTAGDALRSWTTKAEIVARHAKIAAVSKRQEWLTKLFKDNKLTMDDLKDQDVKITNGLQGELRSLPKLEAMGMWAGWYNEKWRASLTNKDTHNFQEADYNLVNASLTDAEKTVARAIQKEIESKRGEIASVVSAISPTIVDSLNNKFTPDARALLKDMYPEHNFFTEEKGYLPALSKNGLDPLETKQTLLEDVAGNKNTPANISMQASFLNDTGEVHLREIQTNLLSIWTQTMEAQEHFIHYAKPLTDMYSIYTMHNKDGKGEDRLSVRDMIEKYYGKDIRGGIDNWIQAVTRPRNHYKNDSFSRMLRGIRRHSALAYLGANIVTIGKQIPAILFFLRSAPMGHLLKSISGSMSPTGWSDLKNFVEQDVVMKNRGQEEVLDDIMLEKFDKHWSDSAFSKFGVNGFTARRKAIKGMMMGIHQMDKITTYVGYKAVYQYEVEQGKSEQEAREIALESVLRHQETSNPADNSRMYKHSDFTSLFMMFTSEASKIWRIASNDIVYRSFVQGKLDKQACRDIALVGTAFMLTALAARGGGDDGEEKTGWKEDVAKSLTASTLNIIPFFGTAASSTFSDMAPGASAPLNIPVAGVQAVKNLVGALKGEKDYSTFFKKASEAALVPGEIQFWRAYKALFSDKPTERTLGMLVNRKRSYESVDDLKPLVAEYKAQQLKERNDPEIRTILNNIDALKKLKDKSSGKDLIDIEDKMKALRRDVPSLRQHNKIWSLMRTEGFNPKEFRRMVQRVAPGMEE